MKFSIPDDIKEPAWGGNGKAIYERSYSREKEDGSKETWRETVYRVVAGNCFDFLENACLERGEPERLYQLIHDLRALPAGRHLWSTGSPRGKRCISNCFSGLYDDEDYSQHACFVFARLLEGGGVGNSYSDKYFKHAKKLDGEVALHLVCLPEHKDYSKIESMLSKEYSPTWFGSITISDTREGWCDALGLLIRAHMNSDKRTDTLVLDLSQIREEGAPLKSFGGFASGPAPLAVMLKSINAILNRHAGEKPSWHMTMEIDHEVAQAVVAGGNRRSSLMSTKYWGDPDIFDFIEIKNTEKNNVALWTMNISIEIDAKFWREYRKGNEAAVKILDRIATGMRRDGEPGVINITRCAEGEEDFFCTNPCLAGDTRFIGPEGKVQFIGFLQNMTVWNGHTWVDSTVRYAGNKETIKLLLDDGRRIVCTPNHILYVGGEKVEAENTLGKSLDELTTPVFDVKTDYKATQAILLGSILPDRGLPARLWYVSLQDKAEIIGHLTKQLARPDQYNNLVFSKCCEEFYRDFQYLLGIFGVRSRVGMDGLKVCDLRSKNNLRKILPQGQPDAIVTALETDNPLPKPIVEQIEKGRTSPVFDFTMAHTHYACVNGLKVANCSEVTLPQAGACCLGSVDLSKFVDDLPGMREAFRLMTRFLIRATWSDYNDERLKKRVERDRRIGVGFMGFHDWLSKLDIKFSEFPQSDNAQAILQEMAQVVSDTARDYAKKLRIPEPIKTRVIAPTGTTSMLGGVSSGFQPVLYKYFLRRVKFTLTDPDKAKKLAEYEKQGLTIEDSVYSDNSKVVVFPSKASILDDDEIDEDVVEEASDISLEDFLAVQATLQDIWADNSISSTCTIDPAVVSVDRVKRALETYAPRLKGMTVFPTVTDRPQLPMEAITKEQYFEHKLKFISASIGECKTCGLETHVD